MIRCFIAIDIPKEIKKEIVAFQEILPMFEGKTTEEENLHLTLKFLGEISEEQVEEVKKSLKTIKIKKFRAKLGDAGLFSPSFIKILWVKIENCDGLQKAVDDSLEKLFKREKGFMSHLTIARVKSVRDKKVFLNAFKGLNPEPLEFDIKKFSLKKSTLTPDGPIYEDILEIKLQ